MVKYRKCGRVFTPDAISTIQSIVKEKYNTSRCQISRAVCHELNWISENGNPKAWVCREFLLELEKEGIIKLPPPDPRSFNRLKKKKFNIDFKEPSRVLQGKLSDFSLPEFKRVSNRSDNSFWEYLTNQYHYLGYKGVLGRFLKYLVYIDDTPVACLGWGGAAWKVNDRDNWIGWDIKSRKQKLRHIVNNFRFVIFPWVKIKYLASHLLSRNIALLLDDWKEQYNIDIFLLETFVEQKRFAGTSYKAANWLKVGETKGYSKGKNNHFRHDIIKDVYLFLPTGKSKEMLL